MRCIFGLIVVSLTAVTATAQQPYGGNPWGSPYGNYGNYGGYAGGVPVGAAGAFRGANAPLSPYLNLLGGGNPAANYYNFVRPNLYSPYRTGAFNPFMGGGGRQTFFPTLHDIDEDDLPRSVVEKRKVEGAEDEYRVKMAPTGHAAGFGNTLGYFGPLTASQGGVGSAGSRGGMQSTGRRR